MMTKKQLDLILKYVERGVDLDVAANAVGSSYSLVLALLERGKVEEERRYTEPKGRVLKDDEFCYDFYMKLKSAKALSVVHVQSALHQAAQEEWRAAAYWLEKENPRKYSTAAVQEALRSIEEGMSVGEVEQ